MGERGPISMDLARIGDSFDSPRMRVTLRPKYAPRCGRLRRTVVASERRGISATNSTVWVQRLDRGSQSAQITGHSHLHGLVTLTKALEVGGPDGGSSVGPDPSE